MKAIWGRSRGHRDDGFGLIETVVALLIAGVVFSALATTLIAAVQASLFGRQNQQATDIMTTQLEQMRTLGYGALAMRDTDLAGDPRVVTSGCTGPNGCLVVNGQKEPVVVVSGGAVFPHVVTTTDVTTNRTTFTVATYVTQLVGSGAPTPELALRASVFITWSTKGTVHTRSTSSIISYGQSGLPLPVFKLSATPSAIAVNPGATVTYALTLFNQGAPDRWNLTLSDAPMGWSWYADTNTSGVKDVGDTAMSDTGLDGIVDTGRIDPGVAFTFFLTRTVPGSGEALGVKPTIVTATSVGQPSASATVTVTTTVVVGVATATPTATSTPPPGLITCTAVPPVSLPMVSGYTLTPYYLHNNGTGDTTAQAQMPMNTAADGQPTLAHYSTDVDSAALGRVLLSSGGSLPTVSSILTSSATQNVADWQRTVKMGGISGGSAVRLWFAGHGATAATQARIVLYTAASPSKPKSALATADITILPGCAGFQEVYVMLPTTTTTLKNNDVVGVRVVVAGGEAALGYDVSQMQASFTIAAY